MQKNNLAENSVSVAIYIESKIDGKSYCKTNGQFTRHLRQHNLTYQDYFEKYITRTNPKCSCGERLAFYQKTESYASSCGQPCCRGKSISNTKKTWLAEQKERDRANKKKAAAGRSKEQVQEQVQKSRKTFKEKYGVVWGSNLESQKDKSRKTKLERYGDEKYNNSRKASKTRIDKTVEEKNSINQLRRSTNLERYGVENVLLTKTTATKINKGNQSIKDYQLPSGKLIGVRGHEPFALDIIFNELKYNESDIIIHDDYSDYSIEIFSYVNVNMHKIKYYPDLYIPKENRIIEIKSQWWWDGYGTEKYRSRLENNLQKRRAVLDKEYNYEVWIFENKYSYKVLKNDKDFQTK